MGGSIIAHFNFTTIVSNTLNYTPSSLMKSYADKYANVHFDYNKYGSSYLEIAGVRYFYDHIQKIALSKHRDLITVHLIDNVLVPMPGTEGNWGEKHWGGKE